MIDFNIDQIANEIDSGSFGGGENTPNSTPAPAPINQATFDPNLVIPYKANGRDISEPLSTVIQRASMGYNYAQLVQQQKQREEAIVQREQALSQQAQKWSQYDEYAGQNPEWADYVRSQWESRLNFGQSNAFNQQNSFTPDQQSQVGLPPEVAKELSEMRSFRDQYKQEQQIRMQQEQDAELASEINSIQSEYPDIDMQSTDPMTGESVEQQILRHAQAHGISNFRAAFRDMYFDKLLARGQTQAKETVAKQMQQQVKSGILGQSNTPMLQSDGGQNMKGKNYHALMDMAAKELGF